MSPTQIEREMTTVYVKDGITYVPHYTEQGYVYPGFTKGNPTISEEQLIYAGAKKTSEYLFMRRYKKSKEQQSWL